MKLKASAISVAIIGACFLASIPATQTGCKNVNGTNVFDMDAAATAIENYLGPVIVFIENSNPETIHQFQTASSAIGVLISNNSTNVAELQTVLSKVSGNALVNLAIGEAVGAYEQYLGQAVANGISQSEIANKLLGAFKNALDRGVKAQIARSRAHRSAIRSRNP